VINLIAVCGPNASGKTRLGVALALHCGGEIISVDSRQVYRHLDIGTGKDLAEYDTPAGRLPHHLIDIVDPGEDYSLWEYQRDFYRVFEEINTRGRMPVAVGGTGLYLEAALKHYEIPNVPADEELRRELMLESVDSLKARLRTSDPDLYARTDISSKKRVVRALEVAEYSATHPVHWGQENPPEIRPLVIGVRWQREVLLRRIEERLDQRLAAGLVAEVGELLDMGVTREQLDRLGMEYRHVPRLLSGEATHEQMREDLLRDIGRLARRQETYFRGMERRGTPIHLVEEASVAAAREIVDPEMRR
jgi:tRNA dimethylallyltransferase